MAQFGKASSKRGKASYSYSIIGMALVLFLFGIMGWFFLNIKKTGDYLKERIQVHAYLNSNINKKKDSVTIDSVMTYLKQQPYINSPDSIEYVDKSKAIQKWEAENDSSWKDFLINNPLPESIDFYVKAEYVKDTSLRSIEQSLRSQFPGTIADFKYPVEVVNKVSGYVKTGGLIFLLISIILTVLVIFSIDNTIRLAMFSNRFLIKTMQMVGATRGFIAKPMVQRAVINGLIASAVAIFCLRSFVSIIEGFMPEFRELGKESGLNYLYLMIILVGILISVISTYRAVIKYLKLKLDDLY